MSFWGILNGKKSHNGFEEEEPGLIDTGYENDALSYGTETDAEDDGNTLSFDRTSRAAASAGNNKVNVKLLSPKSHTEAVAIADELMSKCIVVLDVSNLSSDSAMRLIDFLSGVIHVLGGKMRKTNNGTFVAAPNGVDIGELMPDVNDGE